MADKQDKVSIYSLQQQPAESSLPLFSGAGVKAGFPSPAQDYVRDTIDLNQVLVRHPASTFLVEVEGDSMLGAFIANPSLLIIDRSLPPQNNDIVLAVVNGEFTVKTFYREKDMVTLLPANKKYNPIKITEDMEFSVHGVVTQIIIDPRKTNHVRAGRL